VLTLILLGTIAVCVIGWLKNRLALLAICYYMQMKRYTRPSDEEMKTCSQAVIKRLMSR